MTAASPALAREFATRTGRVLCVLDGAGDDVPPPLQSPARHLETWRHNRRENLAEMIAMTGAKLEDLARLVGLSPSTIRGWLQFKPPTSRSTAKIAAVVEHLGWNYDDLDADELPPQSRPAGNASV